MLAVGLKTLKARLGQYVRLAASGERVLITDRDKVVAELTAPDHPARGLSDHLLADLFASGQARPPIRRYEPAKSRKGAQDRVPSAILDAELERQRGDR